MNDIEEIKKKVLEHDKKLNEEEIYLLEDIKKDIDNFIVKINEIKRYTEYLKEFNIYEIKEEPRLKEEEMDILYELYRKYKDLSESFSSLYEKLLKYHKLIKKEII